MKVTIEGKELVIRIPIGKPVESKSGKTMVVASSRGCIRTDTMVDGQPLTVSVNAFVPKA